MAPRAETAHLRSPVFVLVVLQSTENCLLCFNFFTLNWSTQLLGSCGGSGSFTVCLLKQSFKISAVCNDGITRANSASDQS